MKVFYLICTFFLIVSSEDKLVESAECYRPAVFKTQEEFSRYAHCIQANILDARLGKRTYEEENSQKRFIRYPDIDTQRYNSYENDLYREFYAYLMQKYKNN